MELWQILVLAVVQGIAEFLPISSSGHVVILASLMAGGNAEALDVAEVNIVLHLGTLGSIAIFYWRRIVRLLNEDRATIRLLIVGTIPGVAAGVSVKLLGFGILESPLLAGVMLVVTGLLLLAVSRMRYGNATYQSMTSRNALLIGLSQAAAILPGLSRSGTTISTGLKLGLAPRDAATFSFLLALPVIAGGGAVEVLSIVAGGKSISTPPLYLLVGALVACVIGLFALSWLVRWLESGRLQWFAAWCIPLGLVVIAWQIAIRLQ